MKAFAVALALLASAAFADTLVSNTSGSNYTLPAVYGSLTLTSKAGANHQAIIADTKANVSAALGLPKGQNILTLSQVPSGQTGAIVPNIFPAIPNQQGQVTVTGAATTTVASIPAALLKASTTYIVKAKIVGIGTAASSAGTIGKGLGSELSGVFVTNSSAVPAQVSTTASLVVKKDAALDAGDVPTLSVVSSVIVVQGIAAATEVIDYAVVIEITVAGT
jgi:hypothetical protein